MGRSNREFRAWATACGLLAVLALAGCSGGGSDGATGPAGPSGPPGPAGPAGPAGANPLDTVIGDLEPLPGVNVVITSVTDATGGTLAVGDLVTVRFTVKTDAGVDLDVTKVGGAQIYLSGPTDNYQRVLLPQTDIATRAVNEGGGVWAYTFTTPIPSVYPAPLNDTASFGAADGELQGQPLLDGTYTVGLQMYFYYDVGGVATRDAGSNVKDVLFGAASTISHREVVANANCNVCHTELRAHGGSRVDVQLCVLCHTAGSEDKNVATAAGGTPGVTVDFKVMIHKLHAGEHLASVLGIGVDASGNRDYTAAPKPLQYVGYQNSVVDFSEVAFPVFPSVSVSMPRHSGYTAMSANSAFKAKEDAKLRGPVACAKCHGDPDGAGSAVAPAQGALYRTKPSRQACGACHDDIDWTKNYVSNGITMPGNLANSTCASCHTPSGSALAIDDGHLHPLLDPVFNPGLKFDMVSVTDQGGGAQLDPNDKVQAKFKIVDNNGNPVTITSPTVTGQSITAIIAGPTWNYNLILQSSIPLNHPGLASGVGSPPVYTVNIPALYSYERLGLDTGANGETFTTLKDGHLDLPAVGAGPLIAASPTTVFVRDVQASPGSTTTTAAAAYLQNFVDVASITNFATSDKVVIGDGTAQEEYGNISLIQGNRLWLSNALQFAHPAGEGVLEVKLTTAVRTTEWTLNALTGQITEVNNAFAGRVVICTYWADFRMPSVYPAPINDTPDLGEAQGEWKGKTLVPGTYTLDVYGTIPRVLTRNTETQTYRGASDAGSKDFLLGALPAGTGTVVTEYAKPYDSISNGANCYGCHDDLWFHGGGRRGFGTCIMCHGDSGAEDRVSLTSTTAPGTSIAFREMLHKIHMGKELSNPQTFFAGFDGVGFPAMPGGVAQCVKCHGNSAWKVPGDRNHPTQQVVPAHKWGFVCGSCHDSNSAQAHIALQTVPNGAEACDVCHGPGKGEDVVKVHFPR